MPYGYGILSVDPMHNMPAPDPVGRAINAATGMYNIFGKHYDNQLKSLQNQEKSATLASTVQATNTKNQADTQYYPLRQDADLKEVMARTGLSKAQATEAFAHSNAYNASAYRDRSLVDNPGGAQTKLFQAYMNAPPGSQEKLYYGGLISKATNGFLGVPGSTPAQGGGAPQNGPPPQEGQNSGAPLPPQALSGGVPGSPGPTGRAGPLAGGYSGLADNVGLTSNPLGASRYRTSNQGYLPQTGLNIEAPTTGSQERNQNRYEADAEMKYIGPILQKGFNPYTNLGGTARMIADQALVRADPNSESGKAARDRLLAYNKANRFKREAANIISRQSSGRSPGVNAAREQEASSFGNLPGHWASYLTPTDIAQEGFNQYLPAQQKMADIAINQERKSYPTNGPQPAWYGQQGTPGYFGAYGYVPPQPPHPPQAPPVAAGFNGNPNLPPPGSNSPQQAPQKHSAAQLNEWAQAAIKKGVPKAVALAKLKELQGGQ